MATHADFLAHIRAAPADDLPRLAMADWLHERGDEDMADSIRDGVAMGQMGLTDCPAKVDYKPSPHSAARKIKCGACDFCELEKRSEYRHEAGEWARWAGYAFGFAHTSRHWSQFGPPAAPGPCLYSWRGLVDRVECELAWWLKFGSVVVAGPLAAVQTVIPYGKQPELVLGGTKQENRWVWFRSEIMDGRPHHLPFAAYSQMDRTTFDTEQDAFDGLSRGLLRYAELPF